MFIRVVSESADSSCFDARLVVDLAEFGNLFTASREFQSAEIGVICGSFQTLEDTCP